MIYTGSANTLLMITYFKNILPKLPKNSMIVIDNASWHKSTELKEIFKKFDVELKYQPPYSPDTNPLEKLWGNTKNELRSFFDNNSNLFQNLSRVISNRTIELKS